MSSRELNENIIRDGDMTVEFYGWTSFNNETYPDLYDDVHKYRKWAEPKDGEIIGNVYYDPPEKEEYCDNLCRLGQLADALVAHRCFIKNIKICGYTHQNGDYGTPLLKTKYGIFRYTCSFRYWGGIMADAKHGKNYMDWAWDPLGEEVRPENVEGENLVDDKR